MKLNPESKKKAEALGLIIVQHAGWCVFIKPSGLPGNKLPAPVKFVLSNLVENTEIVHYSDCPIISIMDNREGKPFRVQCWDWIPGPGPGDFELFFDTEEQALDCVLKYLFEENAFFNARRVYEEEKLQ
jgi:hypothetical protein